MIYGDHKARRYQQDHEVKTTARGAAWLRGAEDMSESLSFAGLRSTHPRVQPCRAIVLHWTGGAGGPAAVYRTLRTRSGPRTPDGLSVHYVVGTDGEVVQMAPHGLVCLHAGIANEWSVGIEVVSPGFPMGSAYERERKAGVRREVYSDKWKTTRRAGVKMLDFTEAQNAALVLLVETLCDTLRIPRRVPIDADGSLLRREMRPAELASFAGVLGHAHCHPTKLDPGSAILERLRVKWAG